MRSCRRAQRTISTLSRTRTWKRKTGKSDWVAFKLDIVKYWWSRFTSAFHEEDPSKPISFNLMTGGPEAGYQKPVKLGFAYIMSGPAAVYGQFAKQGAEMAIDEVNAKGGILGRKVQAVFEEHR